MEKTKADRLARVKLQARVRRVKLVATIITTAFSLQLGSVLSTADVVVGISRVRETIDSMPYDEIMDASCFDWLPSALPEFAEQRLQAGRKHFEDLTRAELGLDPSVKDPLSLAVAAWLTCNACEESFAFPDILGHNCLLALKEDISDEWDSVLNMALSQYASRPSGYRGNFEKLREIVVAYGLDPRTATTADMDNATVRLAQCQRETCASLYRHDSEPFSTTKGIRYIMNWRVAVSSDPGSVLLALNIPFCSTDPVVLASSNELHTQRVLL